MSEERDHLLYVISARHEMTWSAFWQSFDLLFMPVACSADTDLGEVRFQRSQTRRALECLAHCDFEFGPNGSRVFAAPPVLARLPIAGFPQAVLCGARSPQTLSQVEDACSEHGCHVRVDGQERTLVFVPSRIVIQADSITSMERAASTLGISLEGIPPAWALSNFAGSLQELLAAAKWPEGTDLTLTRKDFDTQTFQFHTAPRGAAEMRLSRYVGRKGISRHILQKGGSYAFIDCDWGRYAVLQHYGLNVLVYDERQKVVAVPTSTPLPRLLARALALCSGYAPMAAPVERVTWPTIEQVSYDLFRWVPLQIAELVAGRLGQTLIPHPIGFAIQ